MPKFLRLTHTRSLDSILINPDAIICAIQSDMGTVIHLTRDPGPELELIVSESIDEMEKMLDGLNA